MQVIGETMIPSANRASSPNLDLSFLKTDCQRRLFELLNKFEGTKTIVWDDKLIGPFEFVASASQLRKHDAAILFRLSDVPPKFADSTDYALIFLRKDYHAAKLVADILLKVDKSILSKTVLVCVPQRCASIEELIKQSNIPIESLNSIEELAIELFVMDTDLLSMENEYVFQDIVLNNDYSSIYQIVEGLIKLQKFFGPIPRISGQGPAAKLVRDLLVERLRVQPRSSNQPPSQIHQLILIDRQIDLISPLLTQLTYEGLLDEVFGINHGKTSLPAEKFEQMRKDATKGTQVKSPAPKDKTKKFDLRSSEDLFARLRDCHINAVANVLKQSARNLQAEYDECHKGGKTIYEMTNIVKKLKHLKMAEASQSNHVTIAELVNEQTLKPEFIYGLRIEHELLQEDRVNRMNSDIETKLLRQEPPFHVIRLICLQSMVNNGIKSKICEQYKREILQNYGQEYLILLLQLESAKILLTGEKYYETGSFSQLKNKFNLINETVDECNPNHLSYVYGGYSPLSVVVARMLCQSSLQWRSLTENLRMLPEPTILYSDPTLTSQNNSMAANPNEAGRILPSFLSSATSATIGTSVGAPRVRRNSGTSSQSFSNEECQNVLVFYIGGCTFAEISALRFLSQQEENNCEFIIGTTKVINGKTLLKSLWPRTRKFPHA